MAAKEAKSPHPVSVSPLPNMKFSIISLAALFVTAVRAIVISSPVSGSTFIGGSTIAVTGASSSSSGDASVVFSNGIYSVSQNATINSNSWSTIFTVPAGYVGQFTLVASDGNDSMLSTVIVNVVQNAAEPVNFANRHNPSYGRLGRYAEDGDISEFETA